jgi:hypothetical protein
MVVIDITRVKVDNEQLRLVSEDTYRKIQQYRESIDAISKFVESTADSWKGEAADAYRSIFKEEYMRAVMILDEFRAVPEALLSFAGIYSKVLGATDKAAEEIRTFEMQ